MKKAIITILVIMTVFCSAVFADNGFDNYSGLSFGYGISRADADGMKVESNQIQISLTDYGFVDRSPVGIFVEGSLIINTKREINGASVDPPAELMAAIGPALKLNISKSSHLILGVGFQIYTHTDDRNYYKLECNYFGIGGNLEFAYKIGRHFVVSVGANGSFMFGNKCTMIFPYIKEDVSFDSFTEYRVLPKFSAYYAF